MIANIPGVESMTAESYGAPRRKADASESESSRLSNRARIKDEICTAALAEQQRQQLVAAIEVVNQRKEKLAADHCDAAEPLQARLKEIEVQQIASIKSREPACPELEAERSGLIAKLQAMNSDLQSAILREDFTLTQLEADRIVAAKKTVTCTLEHELINSASAPARIAMMVAKSGYDWAYRRNESAAALRNSGFKAAEVADATRLLVEAKQRLDAATLVCIEE